MSVVISKCLHRKVKGKKICIYVYSAKLALKEYGMHRAFSINMNSVTSKLVKPERSFRSRMLLHVEKGWAAQTSLCSVPSVTEVKLLTAAACGKLLQVYTLWLSLICNNDCPKSSTPKWLDSNSLSVRDSDSCCNVNQNSWTAS